MGADTTDVSASPGAVPLACFLARRHERVLSHLQPHHGGVHYSHANNGRPRPENSLVGLRGARVLVFPMRRLLKLPLFSFDVNARPRSPFGCRSLTPLSLSLILLFRVNALSFLFTLSLSLGRCRGLPWRRKTGALNKGNGNESY